MLLRLLLLRIAGLALAVSFGTNADITLPGILAEHMVVQRERPVHVWEKASAEEAVTVAFRGETQATKADGLGRWSVSIYTHKTEFDPKRLITIGALRFIT